MEFFISPLSATDCQGPYQNLPILVFAHIGHQAGRYRLDRHITLNSFHDACQVGLLPL